MMHPRLLVLMILCSVGCSTPKPTSTDAPQSAPVEPATQPTHTEDMAPDLAEPEPANLEPAHTACTHDRMWATFINELEHLRTEYTELADADINNIDYNRWVTMSHAVHIDSRSDPYPCPPRKHCFVVKTPVYEQPDSIFIHMGSKQEPGAQMRVWEPFKNDASSHPLGSIFVDIHVSGGGESRASEIKAALISAVEQAHQSLPQCHGITLDSKGAVPPADSNPSK